jgi:hypothetical protein
MSTVVTTRWLQRRFLPSKIAASALEPITIIELRNHLKIIAEQYLNRQPARRFFRDGVYT